MPHRIRFVAGTALLVVLVGLVVWQGSFSFGDLGPATTEQTYIFWGLSTLVFLLTVLLGFMLFRDAMKLYFQRRAGVEGSRIRTKIVVGALMLTFLPMIFLVLWSVEVLNRNLAKWFSRPAVQISRNLTEISGAMEQDSRQRTHALAQWLADSAPLQEFLRTGITPKDFFQRACEDTGIDEAFIRRKDGGQIAICTAAQPEPAPDRPPPVVRRGKEVASEARIPGDEGSVVVRSRMPFELSLSQQEIAAQLRDYDTLERTRKSTWRFYLQLLLLITLFILFVAAWVAVFLARQITEPVTALLEAARAVRGGDLTHRIRIGAIDELAALVRAFNEMTADLETNRGELERRRRFIEAVLENIPTGVVSLSAEGSILLFNRAMKQMFPGREVLPASRLSEVIPPDYQSDFSRLMKRAQRTGVASRQVDLESPQGPRHLHLTVSALGDTGNAGYVLVIEDTSELLRAQRAAAWHEVARRIAHELKNPLTPITLSSERILRQVERCATAPPEVVRIIRECCAAIGREVDTVKLLVDEFSQFARWPRAHPQPADLNEIVRESLDVFHGRLDSIDIRVSLTEKLPLVALDREQFKRVVVNLVDNAAEAMAGAPLRRLFIGTQWSATDVVALVIADTGCGISVEDREKLFLPYFSTKQRGTGLGLAIVSHIITEHHAQIRVEDNQPVGARFIIELPVAPVSDMQLPPAEVPA